MEKDGCPYKTTGCRGDTVIMYNKPYLLKLVLGKL